MDLDGCGCPGASGGVDQVNGPFHARGELVLKKHSGGLTAEEERLLKSLTKRCRRVFRQEDRRQSRGQRKVLRLVRRVAAQIGAIKAKFDL